jgi:hypothetical protein
MFFALLRKNIAMQRTDTVAFASFNERNLVNTYTKAEVTFQYLLPLAPDSAAVLFSSSRDGFAPTPGSVFIVDDINLEYDHTWLPQNEESPLVAMFPNPGNGTTTFQVKTEAQLQIFDMPGRLLVSDKLAAGASTIRTSLPAGMYHVQLTGSNGNVSRHTLIVQ